MENQNVTAPVVSEKKGGINLKKNIVHRCNCNIAGDIDI